MSRKLEYFFDCSSPWTYLSFRGILELRKNKEFAEKIQSIKRSEIEEKEQSKSQEDLYNEESIYAKFTTAEDNKVMPEFHSVEWDKKLSVISKFKDERLQYFGKKLLYMEKPELLSKEEYNLIHKDTAKKLFPVPAGPRDMIISFSLRALI